MTHFKFVIPNSYGIQNFNRSIRKVMLLKTSPKCDECYMFIFELLRLEFFL